MALRISRDYCNDCCAELAPEMFPYPFYGQAFPGRGLLRGGRRVRGASRGAS